MKHRTSQILYSYWNEVRDGRLAPRRFDIEPARIAGILAETLILERIDPETYRFRLAGTRIGEQFATEMRGQNFLDLWSPVQRPEITQLMQGMIEHGGVGLLRFDVSNKSGRTASFEAILLPLVHTRDVVDRFLGAISADGSTDWMGAEPPSSIRLVDTETVWPDGRPYAMANRASTNRTSEPPPFHPHLALGTIVRQDRRQFRVFQGGRADRDPGKA